MVKTEFIKKYGVSKNFAAQALRQAAALIDEHGLVKYVPQDEGRDGFCAVGAIRMATVGWAWADQWESKSVCKVLRHVHGIKNIGDWNDQTKRTKDQVLKTLRSAACKLEHGWKGK